VAVRFRLACPVCGLEGGWLVRATGETWTASDGQPVDVVAGECDWCGSLVLLAPTEDAVRHIGARERERIARKGRARRALAAPS
jgi:hypothetical protein